MLAGERFLALQMPWQVKTEKREHTLLFRRGYTASPSEELCTTYKAANETVFRHLLLYCERLQCLVSVEVQEPCRLQSYSEVFVDLSTICYRDSK